MTRGGPPDAMRELLATNDPVVLSFVEALLRDAGIAAVVADIHMSNASLVLLPRRVLVTEADWDEARRLMVDANLGDHVPGHDQSR